jgi:DNA polymerase-3 subunit delta
VSVHLVTGSDPVLRDDAVTSLVDELLDGDDRSLTVEEFAIPGRGDDDEVLGRDSVVGAILNAASSPPFMTSRRIVIVREIGNLRAADAAPLVAYLEDPLASTELILVVGGGKTPDALDRAARAHGTVTGPTSEKTVEVLAL